MEQHTKPTFKGSTKKPKKRRPAQLDKVTNVKSKNSYLKKKTTTPLKSSARKFKKQSRKTNTNTSKSPIVDSKTPLLNNKKPYTGRVKKKYLSIPRAQSKLLKTSRNETKKRDSLKPATTTGALIRLNKYIANGGVASRRQADEMIRRGLISVNKVIITTMGYKVNPHDTVRCEDRIIKAEKPVYVLLNKPKGFISTTDDPRERKTVMSLVAQAGNERLYPVGRLDRSTTGLLLLTNDGELTSRLTHPSYKAKKIYKVGLSRPLTKNDFQKIMKGVWLSEGRAVVDDLALVGKDAKTVGIELHIGWNRIIHRIFGVLGYEIISLDRTIYAGLTKKDLPRGKWRSLKTEEIIQLKHF